jgi:hypothetical protein
MSTRTLILAPVLALATIPAHPVGTAAAQAGLGDGPEARLVILRETGQVRDGLPVLSQHDSSSVIAAALQHGFGGVALRLFQMEQRYLLEHEGTDVEPAYLLLSGNEGGFPRFGFYLDEESKREVGFVDLHRSKRLSGRFGASDQIFPHELAHVLLIQLAGPPPSGGSNQVHALALRTDPFYAFHEGFAEHFQVLAIDHPEAAPDTRALSNDSHRLERVRGTLDAYRREIASGWSPLGRLRMTFPFWYSGAEQALRYHAVKENLLAREPSVPRRLLESRDPYGAYLLENTLPGAPASPPRSRRRMESTEGVVASLFVRWVANEGLRGTRRPTPFYEQFGVDADVVSPTENVYLKLFHVLYQAKPVRVADLIEAYRGEFPDEAAYVDAVVSDAFLGQGPATAPELWLANPDFRTGTSLFDQLRGLPRTHTFDLNGASVTDLVAVPGVGLGLAERILRNGPYEAVAELGRVDGLSDELLQRFEAMSSEMTRLTSSSTDERESGLTLAAVLRPYVVRLLLLLALASLAGAVIHRALGSRSNSDSLSRFRLGLNGFAASTSALLGGWALGGLPLAYALITVALLFGLPAALVRLRRTRRFAPALWIFAAWVGAGVPMALLITPLF